MSCLKPFLQYELDVLFVALNPPRQSDTNCHWFSGKQSRFFHLLYRSNLVSQDVDKATADDIVFGSTSINYKGARYGVVDLVPDQVETKSQRVNPKWEHLDMLVRNIQCYQPRLVCVLHYKVQRAINRMQHPAIMGELMYGNCGSILRGCSSTFFLNYFPNGNRYSDRVKIEIFESLRELI